jgi:hypothetical protein
LDLLSIATPITDCGSATSRQMLRVETDIGRGGTAEADPTETLAAKFAVMHNAAFPRTVW